MFVGVSVIEILLFNRKKKKQKKQKKKKNVKISITCITPVLQAIFDFIPDIISFQHVFHLGVGRSQIGWKLKVKTQISVFPWAKIGQNDHSNPKPRKSQIRENYRLYGMPLAHNIFCLFDYMMLTYFIAKEVDTDYVTIDTMHDQHLRR